MSAQGCPFWFYFNICWERHFLEEGSDCIWCVHFRWICSRDHFCTTKRWWWLVLRTASASKDSFAHDWFALLCLHFKLFRVISPYFPGKKLPFVPCSRPFYVRANWVLAPCNLCEGGEFLFVWASGSSRGRPESQGRDTVALTWTTYMVSTYWTLYLTEFSIYNALKVDYKRLKHHST